MPPESIQIEPIAARRVRFNTQTPLVNLNYATLEAMAANPVDIFGAGVERTVTAICNHPVGYSYLMEFPDAGCGYLLQNCDDLDPAPEPAPPMVYVTADIAGIHYQSFGNPRKMYVNRPDGIDLVDFGGTVNTYRDFMGVPNTHLKYGTEVRIMGTAHHPVIPTGYDFLIPMSPRDIWGEFTRIGKPAQLWGYRLSDLSGTLPPPKPKPTATPTVTLVTPPTVEVVPPAAEAAPPTPVIDTRYFNFQFLREDHQPVKYRVMRRCAAFDYATDDDSTRAVLDKGIALDVYGTFTPEPGQTRLYINRKGEALFTHWYGVRELDDQGHRIVEEIPDYSDIDAEEITPETRIAVGTASWLDELVYRSGRAEKAIKTAIRGYFVKQKG